MAIAIGPLLARRLTPIRTVSAEALALHAKIASAPNTAVVPRRMFVSRIFADWAMPDGG